MFSLKTVDRQMIEVCGQTMYINFGHIVIIHMPCKGNKYVLLASVLFVFQLMPVKLTVFMYFFKSPTSVPLKFPENK